MHPTWRHGLGARGREAAAQTQSVGRLCEREAEEAHELSERGEDGHTAAQHQRQQADRALEHDGSHDDEHGDDQGRRRRRRDQQRESEVAGRHADEHALGCGADIGAQSGRPSQNLATKGLSIRLGEVLQHHPRVTGAGHLDPQLGHADDPGEKGLVHVHRLQSGQREPPLLACQHTGVDPQVT